MERKKKEPRQSGEEQRGKKLKVEENKKDRQIGGSMVWRGSEEKKGGCIKKETYLNNFFFPLNIYVYFCFTHVRTHGVSQRERELAREKKASLKSWRDQ